MSRFLAVMRNRISKSNLVLIIFVEWRLALQMQSRNRCNIFKKWNRGNAGPGGHDLLGYLEFVMFICHSLRSPKKSQPSEVNAVERHAGCPDLDRRLFYTRSSFTCKVGPPHPFYKFDYRILELCRKVKDMHAQFYEVIKGFWFGKSILYILFYEILNTDGKVNMYSGIDNWRRIRISYGKWVDFMSWWGIEFQKVIWFWLYS